MTRGHGAGDAKSCASIRAGKFLSGAGEEGSPRLMFPELEGRRRMEVIVVRPRIYSSSILLSGNRFGA